MKIRNSAAILLAAALAVPTTGSAALVRRDMIGSLQFVWEGTPWGFDLSTPVSGYIIYDDAITQTDGGYNFNNYSGWAFHLSIGDVSITEMDAGPAPAFYGGSWATMWFREGQPADLVFETVEDVVDSIPGSQIIASDDWLEDVPGYDYRFYTINDELISNGTYISVVDVEGGFNFSSPVPVSTTVPLPGAAPLLLLGATFLLGSGFRRRTSN